MPIYYLPPHVHSCMANGHLILLDVKKDSYSALAPDISDKLSNVVLSRSIEILSELPVDISLNQAIEELLNENLLQSKFENPIGQGLEGYTLPRNDLSDASIERYPTVSARFLWIFIKALIKSLFFSRVKGAYGLVFSIYGYKRYYPSGKEAHSKVDLAEAISAFRAIRTVFYTAHNHCFFDSAVTMYYLNELGFNPRWVFAVKMEPFFAHCWVQVGEIMVTDYLRTTSKLQPIMAI